MDEPRERADALIPNVWLLLKTNWMTWGIVVISTVVVLWWRRVSLELFDFMQVTIMQTEWFICICLQSTIFIESKFNITTGQGWLVWIQDKIENGAIDRPCIFNIVCFNYKRIYAWWRHQMETFSMLMAIWVGNSPMGNSPVTGEFFSQRPVTRSFDVLFDLRLDGRLSKWSRRRWLETLSRS